MSILNSLLKYIQTDDTNASLTKAATGTDFSDSKRGVDILSKTKPKSIYVDSNLNTSAALVGYDFMEQFTLADFFSRNGGVSWLQDFNIFVKENRTVDCVIHFFNVAPTVDSAQGSQIEIDHTHFLNGKYQGYIKLGTGAYAVSGLAGTELSRCGHVIQQGIPFFAASDDSDLYAVAMYLGTSWTPSSASILQYQLKVLQT